jgi:hypothetical protein
MVFAVVFWIDSKRLVLPLETKDGKIYEVPFVPERETTELAAQRICVAKAAEFGLTSENIVAECIAPVNNRLRQGVEQLIARQQAAAKAAPAALPATQAAQ